MVNLRWAAGNQGFYENPCRHHSLHVLKDVGDDGDELDDGDDGDDITSDAEDRFGKVYTSPMAESRLVPELCLIIMMMMMIMSILTMMPILMTKYMSHVTLISWALEMCPGVAMTVRTRRSSAGSCPPANLSSQNSNNVSFTFLTLAFLFPLLLGGGSGSAAMSLNQESDANKSLRKSFSL